MDERWHGRAVRCRRTFGRACVLLSLAWSGPASAADIQDLYDRLSGNCWACDLLVRTGSSGLDFAQQAFSAVAGQLANLLGVVMALWLSFLAGRLIMPFGPDRTPGALGNMAVRKLAAFAVVLAFLRGQDFFWDYFFMPVFSAGCALSVLLLSLSSGQSCPLVGAGTGLAGAQAALDGMRCPLSQIQDVFTRGMLTGVAMIMGAAWHSWLDVLKFWSWPGQMLQLLSGVPVVLVYAFGFLVFPLFFLDAVLRSVVLVVLAPFVSAFSLFGSTRGMVGKAVGGLCQVALTMVFSAVATGLASRGLAATFAGLLGADGTSGSDWPALIAALDAGRLALSLTQRAYWSILGMGVVAFYMIRASANMAAALTSAHGANFTGATSAVAEMTGAGTSIVQGSAIWTWSLIRRPLHHAGRLAGRAAGRGVGRARDSLAARVSGKTREDGPAS